MKYTHEYKNISELSNWDKNPRQINTKEIDRLKKQITKLGLYKPFLILEDGTVIGGNMRLKACQSLGIKGKVPVSIIYPKSEAEKIEYALSDNDRAGHYIESELHQLIIDNPSLELETFSVDLGEQITLKNLSSDLDEDKYNNQEIDIDSMDDTSILKLTFSGQRYLDVLTMIEAIKRDSESNEDLIFRMLSDYEV